MELIFIFTTAFIVGLSGAMMPGPLLTADIVYSAERGFWAGPWLILGHGLLEIFLIIILLAGAASFLTQPSVATIIAVVGGLFLIYFGFIMVRDVYTGDLHPPGSQSAIKSGQPTRMHPLLTGIIISAANPYWIIWWATIGLSYLTLALKSGTPGIASFYSGHILADFLWYTAIAYIVSKGAGFMTPRIYRSILAICGVFMLGLGGYFLYSGYVGIW